MILFVLQMSDTASVKILSGFPAYMERFIESFLVFMKGSAYTKENKDKRGYYAAEAGNETRNNDRSCSGKCDCVSGFAALE